MPFGRGQGKRAFEQLADAGPVFRVDQHGMETRRTILTVANDQKWFLTKRIPRRRPATHHARHPGAAGFSMLCVSVPKSLNGIAGFSPQSGEGDGLKALLQVRRKTVGSGKCRFTYT